MLGLLTGRPSAAATRTTLSRISTTMEHYEQNGIERHARAGDQTDQLYVELQLVVRRLRRVDAMIGSVAVHEPAAEAWTDIRQRCADALAAVATAAVSVPDALPEHDREPRPLLVRDLRVDGAAHRVWYAETEITTLTQQEFGLLETLAIQPTRVHTKTELLNTVWGYQATPRTRTVDSHASRVRRKLIGAGATEGEWVVTQRGIGYALIRA